MEQEKLDRVKAILKALEGDAGSVNYAVELGYLILPELGKNVEPTKKPTKK